MDLTDFVRERLASRKAVAVQARKALDNWVAAGNDPEQRWALDETVIGVNIAGHYTCVGEEVARFIAFRGPEQEIAEVDALLKILDFIDDDSPMLDGGYAYTDPVLKLLALPYADHPDYDDYSWRP